MQTVDGPRIARDVHDPRTALLAPYRGAILARDGTVLARSGPGGRVYPLGASLAAAVGYDSGRYGTAGLEAAFDRELAARPIASDPVAQFSALLGGRGSPAAIRGETLVTTIDPSVQAALFAAIRGHARAAGVVLDPRTGEILALASVPAFDPARLDADFPALRTDTADPLLDRATSGLYPPGSTFKIVTAGAALQARTITPDSTFADPGFLDVGAARIHDDESEATGTRDLAGAFALSSNVDFATIALGLGVRRWFAAADAWAVRAPLRLGLDAEPDRLPDRRAVTPGVLAQLGFGQADLLVTPLRMALVAAAVANGGVMPRPRIVRELRRGNRTLASYAPSRLARPVSPAVARELTSLMVGAVEHGTGTAAALPGVRVAGKTGTATNASGRAHAWFVAFAPAEAPRAAVAIVVENGGYGGAVAAPVARAALAAALAASAAR